MFKLFSSLFRQSLYSGGMSLFLVALVLAISATTALKFSNQQLHHAIQQQAGELLASDMVLSSTQPLDQQWKNNIQQYQLNHSEVTVFNSMASANDQFVMVNVKAVQDNFPLRGELNISPQSQLKSGEIWLAPRLFDLLKLKVGDDIKIADADFKITGKIIHDANQEIGLSGFSPSVIIHENDIARTNAIQAGSRIDYRLLMSGEVQNIEAFYQHYQSQLTPPMRLRTATEGNTRLMRPIKNLELFMQVANILTLILCGIVIAMTSQRYIKQQQNHIALLRCLGASRQQIMMTFIALLAVVGMIATLFGSALGILFGFSLLKIGMVLLPQIDIQFSIVQILYSALPNALFTYVMVCVGFILPSLFYLSKTSPMQVLRQNELKAMTVSGIMLIGLVSLSLFTVYLTQQVVLSLLIMAVLSVLCLVLYMLMNIFIRALKRFTTLEHWLREPKKISLQVTALALGLSLMTVLLFLKDDLIQRWQQQLPANTPNQFIYGLPPHDKNDLQQQLQDKGWYHTALYPNIRGRLIAKNQQAFTEEQIKQHGALSRELNLTQAEHFPTDNKVTLGEPSFNQTHQVSVEENIAKTLNIQLGDELTFSLPEGDIVAKVVNMRQVEWESFSPNFFFIFSPQTFDENAGSYLGSFHVPKQQEQQLTEIIQQFPNTVFVDIQGIFEQVKRILTVISQLVSLLALLVFVAGLLVLFACLNIMLDERRHEIALLRAIGASKTQLKRYLTIELALVGFIAGLVSIFFAEVISVLITWRMDLKLSIVEQLHWQYWIYLPFGMAILCAILGRYRLRALWYISPLLSLRHLSS